MNINDQRIVMTLDAGGTNFVFSAMQNGEEITEPFTLPSQADNLEKCLGTLVEGFKKVKAMLPAEPVAISFAFPGPADYAAGIIGDLPNFPSFRGGIPLGPFLESVFGIPVFINNDGSLFAYGEALAGALPEVNEDLKEAGSPKRFHNLLGITFGTGFGAGVVFDGNLVLGDNSCGGDIWCFRHKKLTNLVAEEGVSIRAVKRVYAERSGDKRELTPKDICMIADGAAEGDSAAARAAFEEMGEIAGDAIASALTIVDGIVVIGGGLTGASKYFMPRLVAELNSTLGIHETLTDRMQMKAYNLEDPVQLADFCQGDPRMITVPGTLKQVPYDPKRRIGVMISRNGASRSIALGAYVYALRHLPVEL